VVGSWWRRPTKENPYGAVCFCFPGPFVISYLLLFAQSLAINTSDLTSSPLLPCSSARHNQLFSRSHQLSCPTHPSCCYKTTPPRLHGCASFRHFTVTCKPPGTVSTTDSEKILFVALHRVFCLKFETVISATRRNISHNDLKSYPLSLEAAFESCC
jgi:hypothetical protein